MKRPRIDWSAADWTLPNAEIARALGCNPSAVTHARRSRGIPASPKTKRKLTPEEKIARASERYRRSYAGKAELRGEIDWRMSDLEISLRCGASVAQVWRWRKEDKLKTKPYTIKQTVLRLIAADAKNSERATVHHWLNLKGVPQDEYGIPICLLRRLAIALNITELFPE